VAGLWFSPGTPVSSTNKTDCHDITEILLKVALNTIMGRSTFPLIETSACVIMVGNNDFVSKIIDHKHGSIHNFLSFKTYPKKV
jgi:hypothetical protein